MSCPICGSNWVVETTDSDGVENIRVCLNCGKTIRDDGDECISPYSYPLRQEEGL